MKKVATPPPPPPPVSAKKAAAARRPSTSVPVIRRNDENAGRPKREIHPPPPRDLPYSDAPKKTRKVKTPRDDPNIGQLKFCEKVLKELFNKKHWTIANAFYEPVGEFKYLSVCLVCSCGIDWIKMDLPSYPKVVKKPMDLSTLRKRLNDGEYSTADKFREEFKLMIRNCFAFNPPKNPVHEAGKALDRLFDEKWKQLPPLHAEESEDEDEEDDANSEDERARACSFFFLYAIIK